jgi:hypothetical protein
VATQKQSVWKKYYNAHAVEQAYLGGDMASAWSKLEEYAARLALVVHYVRWAAGAVADETRLDVASMDAGIALARWFKCEAWRAYAMLDESDDERDQHRLADWIDRKGGTATAREVQMGCRWLRGAGAAEAALEELVKAGCGSWSSEPPPATGGHSRRVFVLSTPSTSTLAKKTREIRPSVVVDSVDTSKTPPAGGQTGPRPTASPPTGAPASPPADAPASPSADPRPASRPGGKPTWDDPSGAGPYGERF